MFLGARVVPVPLMTREACLHAFGGVQSIAVTLSEHVHLNVDIAVPSPAEGVVLFVSRDPRNHRVAEELRAAGLATVLVHLLTPEEELVDALTGERRFDIELLSARIVALIDWVETHSPTAGLAIGLFGVGAGAAAALVAAVDQPQAVRAIVAAGGRPDLAGRALRWVEQPTLFIVAENDERGIDLSRRGMHEMPGDPRLELVPDAVEAVAALAHGWFVEHLRPENRPLSGP